MSDFVVMVDKSAGNAEVGEMWTETYVFPKEATLFEVVQKIDPHSCKDFDGNPIMPTNLGNVRIQVAK